MVIHFDTEPFSHSQEVSIDKEEVLGISSGNKIISSLINNESSAISSANMIKSALNQGISAFFPANIFEQLIKNISIAKNLYGQTFIREITGFMISDIEKNITIPEFQKELHSNIIKNFERMKTELLVTEQGEITEIGYLSAGIIMLKEEIDKLIPLGILGEKTSNLPFIYGDKWAIKDFKKGDRYRDIALKSSSKIAILRAHKRLISHDLKSYRRKSKGGIYVIYAMDASSSMKGEKLELCKKAGIALAYKAILSKDRVGLIVFGSDIKKSLMPTDEFLRLLMAISGITASKETNISMTINKAVEMFPKQAVTKHLILLTYAMPTVGVRPERETLEAVSNARNNGVTISIGGIMLNEKAKKLAEDIARHGEGRFYLVNDIQNLDIILLEDYYAL